MNKDFPVLESFEETRVSVKSAKRAIFHAQECIGSELGSVADLVRVSLALIRNELEQLDNRIDFHILQQQEKLGEVKDDR